MLLAPELFQVARREIGAEMLFIAAPSREGVVYIDAAAPGAIVHTQSAVEIGLGQDHPQSAFIYTLSESDKDPVPALCYKDGAFHAVA